MRHIIKSIFTIMFIFLNITLFTNAQVASSTVAPIVVAPSPTPSPSTAISVSVGDNSFNNNAINATGTGDIRPQPGDFNFTQQNIDSCANIKSDLIYGVNNKKNISNIKQLQKFLLATNYLDKDSGYTEGEFDEETMVALLDFQEEHNLKKEYKLSAAARKIINDISCEYRFAYILNKGANINTVDKDGDSPLIYATKNNQPFIVDMLVRAGANVNIINKDGMTALMFSIINDMATTSKLLINAGTNLNHIAISQDGKATNTAFSLAMEYDRDDIAKYIISRPYDINIKTGLGLTAVNLSVVYGKDNILNEIIKKNPDISITDNNKASPLLYSVFSNNATTVKAILKVHSDDVVIDLQDSKGKTALMYSLENRNTEIFNILIKKNPDLDIRDDWGRTALIYSIASGLPKLSRVIINRGADIDLSDIDGKTPLMYTILYNQADTYNLIKDKLIKIEESQKTSTATSSSVEVPVKKYASTSIDYIPQIIPSWNSIISTSTFTLSTPSNNNTYSTSTRNIYILPNINNTNNKPSTNTKPITVRI